MPHHQFQQQLVQQTTTTTTTPSQHQNLLNQPQSLQLPTQSQSSLINNLNQSPSSNTISSSSQSSSPNSSSQQQQQQQQQQHQHVAAAAAILAANRVFSNTSATSPFLNHHMNPYNHLTFNQHHPDMAALQNCLPNRHEQFSGVNLVSKRKYT